MNYFDTVERRLHSNRTVLITGNLLKEFIDEYVSEVTEDEKKFVSGSDYINSLNDKNVYRIMMIRPEEYDDPYFDIKVADVTDEVNQ